MSVSSEILVVPTSTSTSTGQSLYTPGPVLPPTSLTDCCWLLAERSASSSSGMLAGVTQTWAGPSGLTALALIKPVGLPCTVDLHQPTTARDSKLVVVAIEYRTLSTAAACLTFTQ